MDRVKLNLILTVACFVMLIFLLLIVQERIGLQKDLIELINNTDDYMCCEAYQNPTLPYLCGIMRNINNTDVEEFSLPS